MIRRVARLAAGLGMCIAIAIGCSFDTSLREYLDIHFWQPFFKKASAFERKGVKRVSSPFSGMAKVASNSPMDRLRAEYQKISKPQVDALDIAPLKAVLAAARAQSGLARRDREEIDLIDAKIEMRAVQPGQAGRLQSVQKKFEAIVMTAQTPEWISEARGWAAYMHVLQGDLAGAGKMYLDELNRDGSNLGRDTMLESLKLTFRSDGKSQLLEHLDGFFDTPQHAVFAIQILTNPAWNIYASPEENASRRNADAQAYLRIKTLLDAHRDLLRSATGANALALLTMRVALRRGDPAEVLKIATTIPANSLERREPDFLWMLASAHFILRDYSGAEQPLLALFRSLPTTDNRKAAAAYGLCGVYLKTNRRVEQIRYAVWLNDALALRPQIDFPGGNVEDQTIYWPISGWDLSLLLDHEAPIEALEQYLSQKPSRTGAQLVKYSLAVRRARMDEYGTAASLYQSIGATRRAERMRKLEELFEAANAAAQSQQDRHESQYKLAEYLSANPERLYFNDWLWGGLQNYALYSERDSGLTGDEHKALADGERKLRDDQEERWRAYLILNGIVETEGATDLGRKSAELAVRTLRRISSRFGRRDEIMKADIRLSNFLKSSRL